MKELVSTRRIINQLEITNMDLSRKNYVKPIYFINRITGPVGKKEAADMIQVDLKRTFDIVPDDTEVPKGIIIES